MEVPKKIKDAIIELNNLNETFKNAENEYKSRKSKLTNDIQNYMATKKIDFVEFKNNLQFWNTKLVCPKKVIFDADKLEKRLSKETCKKIISKKYSIEDFDGLIEYLKECNVDPKKFKEFLSIEKTVNNKKIDELSELGEIKEEDIKGCYTVKDIQSYLKISEVEDAEGGN